MAGGLLGAVIIWIYEALVWVGAQQQIPESCVGADELRHDGPGRREHDGDLESSEDVAHRRRQTNVAEGLPRARAHRARDIEHTLVEGAKAGHAGHQGWKEAQQKGKQYLGKRAKAEPDDEQRRNGDLRNQLEKQDERVERALQEFERDDHQAQRHADRRGNQESKHDLGRGHQSVFPDERA